MDNKLGFILVSVWIIIQTLKLSTTKPISSDSEMMSSSTDDFYEVSESYEEISYYLEDIFMDEDVELQGREKDSLNISSEEPDSLSAEIDNITYIKHFFMKMQSNITGILKEFENLLLEVDNSESAENYNISYRSVDGHDLINMYVNETDETITVEVQPHAEEEVNIEFSEDGTKILLPGTSEEDNFEFGMSARAFLSQRDDWEDKMNILTEKMNIRGMAETICSEFMSNEMPFLKTPDEIPSFFRDDRIKFDYERQHSEMYKMRIPFSVVYKCRECSSTHCTFIGPEDETKPTIDESKKNEKNKQKVPSKKIKYKESDECEGEYDYCDNEEYYDSDYQYENIRIKLKRNKGKSKPKKKKKSQKLTEDYDDSEELERDLKQGKGLDERQSLLTDPNIKAEFDAGFQRYVPETNMRGGLISSIVSPVTYLLDGTISRTIQNSNAQGNPVLDVVSLLPKQIFDIAETGMKSYNIRDPNENFNTDTKFGVKIRN